METQATKITKTRNSLKPILFVFGVIFILSSRYHSRSFTWFSDSTPTQALNSPQYAHLASHCANIPPISSSEFHARQTELANALFALNASAYIAEPGANTQFFGNFSKSHWSLSERPLLLVISLETPEFNQELGVKIRPRVTILTPKVFKHHFFFSN